MRVPELRVVQGAGQEESLLLLRRRSGLHTFSCCRPDQQALTQLHGEEPDPAGRLHALETARVHCGLLYTVLHGSRGQLLILAADSGSPGQPQAAIEHSLMVSPSADHLTFSPCGILLALVQVQDGLPGSCMLVVIHLPSGARHEQTLPSGPVTRVVWGPESSQLALCSPAEGTDSMRVHTVSLLAG